MDKYIKGISLIISSCIIAGAIIYHGQVGRYHLNHPTNENAELIDTKTGKTYGLKYKGTNHYNWVLKYEFAKQPEVVK